jgi:hypothetical protein
MKSENNTGVDTKNDATYHSRSGPMHIDDRRYEDFPVSTAYHISHHRENCLSKVAGIEVMVTILTLTVLPEMAVDSTNLTITKVFAIAPLLHFWHLP